MTSPPKHMRSTSIPMRRQVGAWRSLWTRFGRSALQRRSFGADGGSQPRRNWVECAQERVSPPPGVPAATGGLLPPCVEKCHRGREEEQWRTCFTIAGHRDTRPRERDKMPRGALGMRDGGTQAPRVQRRCTASVPRRVPRPRMGKSEAFHPSDVWNLPSSLGVRRVMVRTRPWAGQEWRSCG